MFYKKKDLNALKHRKITLSVQIEKSLRALTIAMILLFVILLSTYIYIGNEGQVKGNVLKKLKQENDALYNETKILEKKIIEAKTFGNIKEQDKTKSMKVSDNMIYIKNSNVAVDNAKRY